MKKPVAIKSVMRVRRDKPRKQRHGIKRDQDSTTDHRDAPTFQPLPEDLPWRERDRIQIGRGGFHLFQTDARVAPREQNISDKISHHQQRGGHDDAVHHEVGIFSKESLDGQASKTGPRHDVFYDESSA